MTRLSRYGARVIEIDGARVVEMVDPNDNTGTRHQYRVGPHGPERRALCGDGSPFRDTGSPWTQIDGHELAQMRAARGRYHPILDPLGIAYAQ